MSYPSWWDHAACDGTDWYPFFGFEHESQREKRRRERDARDICGRCEVRQECLAYAISRPEKYGTWGGMTEDERAELRRRMRNGAAA